jgi:hypothetical protein
MGCGASSSVPMPDEEIQRLRNLKLDAERKRREAQAAALAQAERKAQAAKAAEDARRKAEENRAKELGRDPWEFCPFGERLEREFYEESDESRRLAALR